LTAVHKIYIDSLGDGKGAAAMKARLAERLAAAKKFQVVASPADADAVLKGTGRIWTTGYVSAGVRATRAGREPVFDGFLSVELLRKSGNTLWSYLVTPSKFSVKPITSDLADQIAEKLSAADAHLTEEPASPTSTEKGSPPVSLHGAGATFPWPLYQKWIDSYEQKTPNTQMRYEPKGSQSGIELLEAGQIDFAASDMPLTDETMRQSNAKFLHVASVMGAVVPIYNLKDVNRSLNFTPAALAGIYLGTIKKWNDPAIRSSNPGVFLPDSEIIVTHRSDGSGTTFVWTDFLSKTSPAWKSHVGDAAPAISWPTGQGAEGSEGIVALIQQTPNSIGYVELTYAIQHELPYGAVRNAAGNFVRADLASVTAAASAITGASSPDFRLSITNAPGKDAYPIATFTWLLAPVANEGSPKSAALIEFLRWALTSGQRQCSGLGYAPLPSSVAERQLQTLNTLK
jgi:phosphate ABC transporter phosphate-binding protein